MTRQSSREIIADANRQIANLASLLGIIAECLAADPDHARISEAISGCETLARRADSTLAQVEA